MPSNAPLPSGQSCAFACQLSQDVERPGASFDEGQLLAESVRSWRLQKADLRHGGPAGRRHLATTHGETRSRPEAGTGQAEKQSFNVEMTGGQ